MDSSDNNVTTDKKEDSFDASKGSLLEFMLWRP